MRWGAGFAGVDDAEVAGFLGCRAANRVGRRSRFFFAEGARCNNGAGLTVALDETRPTVWHPLTPKPRATQPRALHHVNLCFMSIHCTQSAPSSLARTLREPRVFYTFFLAKDTPLRFTLQNYFSGCWRSCNNCLTKETRISSIEAKATVCQGESPTRFKGDRFVVKGEFRKRSEARKKKRGSWER